MSPEQRRKYNGRLQEQLQDVIDDYTGITSYRHDPDCAEASRHAILHA